MQSLDQEVFDMPIILQHLCVAALITATAVLAYRSHIRGLFAREAADCLAELAELMKGQNAEGALAKYEKLLFCLNCGQPPKKSDETATRIDPGRIGLGQSELIRYKRRFCEYEARKLLALLRAGKGSKDDVERLIKYVERAGMLMREVGTDDREMVRHIRGMDIRLAREKFKTCFRMEDITALKAAFHYIKERGIELHELKLERNDLVAAFERAHAARQKRTAST